jgi:dipeptidyl aminopeptidase/acylaminoacyl peptidase
MTAYRSGRSVTSRSAALDRSATWWYAAYTASNIRSRATVLLAALAALAASVSPDPADAQGDGVIVFESNRDGLTEIYAIGSDGSGATRLTENGVREIAPVWAPDASSIAFSRGRASWDLYRRDADGGEERLTTTRTDELNPAWSPDGTAIVFERQRQLARRRQADVYVLELGTGEERPVARSRREEITPTWSPDGSKIAFAARRGADFEIVVTELASGASRVVTSNRSDDVGPEWSPDGTQIAFSRMRGRDSALVVRDVASGRERRLETIVGAPFGPTWSPDGSALAFAAPNPRDRAVEGEYELFRLDLASGEVRALTSGYPGRDVAGDWSAGDSAALAGPARFALLQPPSFCTSVGGPRRDRLVGGLFARDVLCGRGGADTLLGYGGHDTLKGGFGDDRLLGGRGSDDFVTRLDGPGDVARGGRGADEAWIDCGQDRVRSAAARCG